MCISAGIDGANAIRWEEGNNRVATTSETDHSESARPHTYNFANGPSMVSRRFSIRMAKTVTKNPFRTSLA